MDTTSSITTSTTKVNASENASSSLSSTTTVKQLPPHLGKNRKNKLKKWIMLVLILAVAGAAVWYFFFRGEAAQLPFIRFAAIDKGDVIKSVTATGTLQATKTVQVGSQVSGTIKSLHADFNTRVKKGDLVAELDPTFYEAAVKSAQANYSRAKADLNNAEKIEARSKELLSKQLVSRAEYDVTETALADAKATVQQIQASLDQANVNLSYTKIHAPISGIVTQRSVDVGQTVAASLSAPVLFIIAEDLTEMEVAANVDEADIGQVKQDEDVSFTVDAFPGEKFHGIVKMVRLNPIIQSNVVTYTVVISAQNKEEKLFPGMTATVTITNSAAHDVIRIPAAAIRFTPPSLDNSTGSTAKSGNHDSTSGHGGARRDSSQGHRGTGSKNGTIYRRAVGPVEAGKLPTLEAIKITMGISDGMNTEVLTSDKPLNVGDSIAIGSVMPAKAAGSAPAGATPFGTQPGGRGR